MEHRVDQPKEPMGDTPLPKRPLTLPPLADDTLTALSAEPVGTHIILGGGVALQHYDNFRMTHDVDAWWRGEHDSESLHQISAALNPVASAHGLGLEHRRFGQTDSFEFHREGSRRKEFSFQISDRDVALDEPLPSSWPPLTIETFRDNIGSKMNALVNRGAPRDFVDIYRVVQDGLLTINDCWNLYREKNAGASLDVARAQTLTSLTRIEARRPLDAISDVGERRDAGVLRGWFRGAFLQEQQHLGPEQAVEPDIGIGMDP